MDNALEKIKNLWNSLNIKGKILLCCTALSALLTIVVLICGRSTTCVATILATVLYGYGLQVIRGKKTPKKPWLNTAAIIVATIMLASCMANLNNYHNYQVDRNNYEPIETEFDEKLIWPEHKLLDLLPIPKSQIGTVEYLYDDEACIFVARTTKSDYLEYVNACEEKGFNIDVSQERTIFTAKNEDGYRLNIQYSLDESMMITIGEPLYNLDLEVECIENWFLNTYDIDIYINGDEIGTLLHGASDTYEVELKAGKCEIVFFSNESHEVKGKIELDIESNVTASFKLYCHSNKINVDTVYIDRDIPLNENEIKMPCFSSDYEYKNYKTVVTELKRLGFTNIKTKAVYDISFGLLYSEGDTDKVTIKGNSFSKGDVFNKTDKVVVTYHDLIENEPEKTPAPTQSISKNDENKIPDDTIEMPILKGTNIDIVKNKAATFGVTKVWSVEDWGHGLKMMAISNEDGSLNIDIGYSTETKEVVFGSIVTINLTSSQQQQAFIKGMAVVLCPAKDTDTITSWVNSNVGGKSTKEIGGTIYELSVGPSNNALYYAGVKNWEEWDAFINYGIIPK